MLEAKRIADRLEIHYTPKHGSWLDMAEIELGILGRQCLNRRIADAKTLRRQIAAWESKRNAKKTKVNWRFTTDIGDPGKVRQIIFLIYAGKRKALHYFDNLGAE